MMSSILKAGSKFLTIGRSFEIHFLCTIDVELTNGSATLVRIRHELFIWINTMNSLYTTPSIHEVSQAINNAYDLEVNNEAPTAQTIYSTLFWDKLLSPQEKETVRLLGARSARDQAGLYSVTLQKKYGREIANFLLGQMFLTGSTLQQNNQRLELTKNVQTAATFLSKALPSEGGPDLPTLHYLKKICEQDPNVQLNSATTALLHKHEKAQHQLDSTESESLFTTSADDSDSESSSPIETDGTRHGEILHIPPQSFDQYNP